VPVELRWGERTFDEVDGVDIHVEVAGPVDAPVLGLLHGFSSGTFTWAGVAPLLADRFRLVAWDRPPFGRSGRPTPGAGGDPYTAAAMVRHGAAVLRRHGSAEAPLVLVGHSAGTVVATDLARAGRPRVDGLVLVAPAFDGGPPSAVRRALALPGAAVVGTAALRASLVATGPVIRAVGRHRTPLLDATAAESGRLLNRPGTARALVHLTRTWEPPAIPAASDLPGVAVAVVVGAEDRLVDPARQAALGRALDAEVHVLDHVGHAPQEQDPGAVATIIGAFAEAVAR
jgi:magnesium chelatase accessory protein